MAVHNRDSRWCTDLSVQMEMEIPPSNPVGQSGVQIDWSPLILCLHFNTCVVLHSSRSKRIVIVSSPIPTSPDCGIQTLTLSSPLREKTPVERTSHPQMTTQDQFYLRY
jgi:hypothetical protein